jgi:hypothetical protein
MVLTIAVGLNIFGVQLSVQTKGFDFTSFDVFATKNQPTETIGLPKNDDSIASVEIVKLC